MNDQDNTVVLTDDKGNEIKCDYLDTIPLSGKDYVVLYPLDQGEDEGEVIILELVETGDGLEDYVPVEDEKVLDSVFDEYMRISQLDPQDN